MKAFLEKKKVYLSAKVYLIDALGAMAYGLFATLLVGTILKTIGDSFHWIFLSETIWPLAQLATGPAIAVAIAQALQAPPLVLLAATVVGLAGDQAAGPIGVYLATLLAVECGKLISQETKIDIVLTPVVTVFSGVLGANFMGPYIQQVMVSIGELVIVATNKEPFMMGILVSVIVGMVLTLPISSAALCMMLSLSGLAGGAATVGCCCQMIGFAVISYQDNGLQGLIAQGLGTSMLQVPNIMKNWKIWIPPTLASAILGPLSTLVFKMENTALGSGMGTSGLVGQIATLTAMDRPLGQLLLQIALLHFILPALVTYLIYRLLVRLAWIRPGDMKLFDE